MEQAAAPAVIRLKWARVEPVAASNGTGAASPGEAPPELPPVMPALAAHAAAPAIAAVRMSYPRRAGRWNLVAIMEGVSTTRN